MKPTAPFRSIILPWVIFVSLGGATTHYAKDLFASPSPHQCSVAFGADDRSKWVRVQSIPRMALLLPTCSFSGLGLQRSEAAGSGERKALRVTNPERDEDDTRYGRA